jgi:hypothetical protein
VLPDLGLGFARFWAVDWRYVNRHVAGILWLLPFAAMGTEVCSAGQRVNSLRLHQWPVFAHFDTGHIVGNTQTG